MVNLAEEAKIENCRPGATSDSADITGRVLTMNIYVGNLSPDITEQELRLEFGAFGQVSSVVVMSDKYTGRDRPGGHGFVEMTSKAEGAAAIAGLKGKSLKSMPIDVVEALPLSDKKMATRGLGKENASSAGRERRSH